MNTIFEKVRLTIGAYEEPKNFSDKVFDFIEAKHLEKVTTFLVVSLAVLTTMIWCIIFYAIAHTLIPNTATKIISTPFLIISITVLIFGKFTTFFFVGSALARYSDRSWLEKLNRRYFRLMTVPMLFLQSAAACAIIFITPLF